MGSITGDRIRSIRKQMNMTQEEFAGAVGIMQNTLSRIESGIRMPGRDVLMAISKYCETTPEYLLGQSDQPTSYEKQVAYIFGSGGNRNQNQIALSMMNASAADIATAIMNSRNEYEVRQIVELLRKDIGAGEESETTISRSMKHDRVARAVCKLFNRESQIRIATAILQTAVNTNGHVLPVINTFVEEKDGEKVMYLDTNPDD